MLGAAEIQGLLRDYLFHGLQKPLYNSLHYLYVDLRVMHPQLVTAAHKAEAEHEDKTGEGVWIKAVQIEGNDEIKNLKEQTVQLEVVIQKP